MTDTPDLADTLAAVARAIHAPTDVSSTLDAIVRCATETLPGVDHVGISVLHRRGEIQTMAGTDQLVWALDAVQYELREGPCYDAIAHSSVTVANGLHHDQRWPRYVRRAAQHGVRAQMGLRLFVEDETLGGLNLYATAVDHIDPEVQHLAQLFAVHAALALGKAQHDEELDTALGTRKVIGQALGIVMERYQLDEDRAFQFLVRVSSQSNIKLRRVAQQLVDQANRREPGTDKPDD